MKPLTPAEPVAQTAIRIDSHLSEPEERSLADDVLDGLTRPFKELPPKHFYDARGAELFDRICELGSGTAAKTRVLLDALHEAGTLVRYVPVDVTESVVRDCAEELTDEYPGLHVHGVIGDF